MLLPRVPVHVRHEFAHPADVAYAWLTDYRDDDPKCGGPTLRERVVIERSATRVVLEEELELGGVVGKGVFEVRLDPPHHWVAEITRGAGRGSRHDYRLTPTATGCRLDVRYGIRAKRIRTFLRLWRARKRLRRELTRMWARFGDAMDADASRDGDAPDR